MEIKSRRLIRRERRTKDTLRCEWCNRHVRVAHKFWQSMKDTPYIWFCSRDRCIAGRSECLGEYSLERLPDGVTVSGKRLRSAK